MLVETRLSATADRHDPELVPFFIGTPIDFDKPNLR
jgi:hypothetical protein